MTKYGLTQSLLDKIANQLVSTELASLKGQFRIDNFRAQLIELGFEPPAVDHMIEVRKEVAEWRAREKFEVWKEDLDDKRQSTIDGQETPVIDSPGD